MTSLIKYVMFLGIMILMLGTSPLQGTDQNISTTSPILDRIWSQPYNDQTNNWWVFVDLQIDTQYWHNLQTYSLIVSIQDQKIDLIPNVNSNDKELDKIQFIGELNDISTGIYYVSIEWKDDTTSKVWINEKLQVGNTSSIDKFHFIAPVVILVAVLTLVVIFPGKIKIQDHIKSSNELEDTK